MTTLFVIWGSMTLIERVSLLAAPIGGAIATYFVTITIFG